MLTDNIGCLIPAPRHPPVNQHSPYKFAIETALAPNPLFERWIDWLAHSREPRIQIKARLRHRGQHNISRCFRILQSIMGLELVAN